MPRDSLPLPIIMKRFTYIFTLLIFAGATLTACDSNKDELSDEALQDFTDMMTNAFGVFSLLSVELAPDPTSEKSASSKDLYPCPNGGEVDFNVTNIGGDNNAISYAMDFNDCNGLNGSLLYDIGGEFTENGINIDITINGNIVESCSITFSAFNEKIVADLTDGASSFAFTVNGRISSSCGNEAFSCLFDNDTFDTSNTGFFQDRCQLN